MLETQIDGQSRLPILGNYIRHSVLLVWSRYVRSVVPAVPLHALFRLQQLPWKPVNIVIGCVGKVVRHICTNVVLKEFYSRGCPLIMSTIFNPVFFLKILYLPLVSLCQELPNKIM